MTSSLIHNQDLFIIIVLPGIPAIPYDYQAFDRANMGFISAISDFVFTTDDAMRLTISILAGYPLAAIYRTFIFNKSATVQHLYFITAGIVLYLFNCGYQIYHSILSLALAFIICNNFSHSSLSVALAHVCFLGHLLVGYWFAESDKYDITWTTPFCIMTLRLIGLVMDVYDGQKPKESMKADQLETRIENPPGLIETYAYGLFFSGTLVGPQFTLQKFRKFVGGQFLDPQNGQVRSSSLYPSIGRFVAGCVYAVLHQWGMHWIPSEYLNSPHFLNQSFLWKCIWIMIWFRLVMFRYCAAWLLTEGAAILCGLGYNGSDENGDDKWNGVRDLHILQWEFGYDFQSVIESFNVGTNTFAKNHLFRRLRWVGSKFLSHLLTLMYLAVWHGYHLGYFILFIYELSSVVGQDMLYLLIDRTPGVRQFLDQSWMRPFCWLFGRIAITLTMAFGFLTFGLVKKEIWIQPVKSMYFFGYIFYFIAWPLTYQILIRILPKKSKNTTNKRLAENVDSRAKIE